MGNEIIFIALLLNLLSILTILFLSYKVNRVLGGFEPYMKDVEKMRYTIAKRGNDILAKTITVAQDIIRNAIAASQKNLRVSESLQEEMGKMMREGISQNISESKQMIQDEVRDITDAYQRQFNLLAKEVQASAMFAHNQLLESSKGMIDEFATDLRSELEGLRTAAAEKISQSILEAEKGTAAYREQKIKDLDTKIYQIIGEIAKKTLGHAIDVSTHEQLVVEALEKAKKENLL
jgi:F0F1-type ATP synthase membrane subunit b/b'